MMDAFSCNSGRVIRLLPEGDLLYRICRALQSGSMRRREKSPQAFAKSDNFSTTRF
jgi:hypothetical protein